MKLGDTDLSLSCIIPMHNEEKNVKRVIGEARSMFEQLKLDWEIVIIESGSTDNTFEKANETARGENRIRVFHQEKREGIGSALRFAYSKCAKDLVFHLEADSPFEMLYFKKALPILLENDCVIGFRVGPREKNFKWAYYNMGRPMILRTLYHVGYGLLLRLVFGLVVRDVNFGFKIFKRKEIEKLNLISKGWFIDAEILLELKRNGVLPVELPIIYKDRTAGRSTVDLYRTPANIIYEMIGYINARKRRR